MNDNKDIKSDEDVDNALDGIRIDDAAIIHSLDGIPIEIKEKWKSASSILEILRDVERNSFTAGVKWRDTKPHHDLFRVVEAARRVGRLGALQYSPDNFLWMKEEIERLNEALKKIHGDLK